MPSKREGSFKERFLLPAARGELNKKHESVIPKLAGRKGHARLTPPDPASMASKLMDSESPFDEEWEVDEEEGTDDDEDDEVEIPPAMYQSLSGGAPGSFQPSTLASTSSSGAKPRSASASPFTSRFL